MMNNTKNNVQKPGKKCLIDMFVFCLKYKIQNLQWKYVR